MTKQYTVAGLVIHEARMIPEKGQAFTFHGFRFEVVGKKRNQITRLRITPVTASHEELPRQLLNKHPKASGKAATHRRPLPHIARRTGVSDAVEFKQKCRA
jgi:hypothetical protein